MKNIFLILLLIFLSVFQTTAASAQISLDTIPKEKYQLSKKDFLVLYDIDDTSRALIEVYFNERNMGGSLLIVYGVFFMGEGAVIAAATMAGDSFGGYAVVLAAAAYTVLVFLPAQIFLGLGLDGIITYSKKNLYIDLINYYNGHGIRKKLKKHVIKQLSYK